MNKVCKKCGIEKPIAQFSINRAARDGRINNCKPCEVKRVAEWTKTNPLKVKAWADRNIKNNRRASLPVHTTKQCSKCGKTKLLNEFGANSRSKDYVRSYCKVCAVDHMMAKYGKDPETYRAKSAAWRKKNPGRYREYMARYHEENRTHRNEYRRLLRLENLEKEKEKDRQWTQNNRAKVYAKNARRRASQTCATPRWLSAIQLAQIEEFYEVALARKMQTGIDHDVDHIVPLRGGVVNGLHVPWNLQVLTQTANNVKYNKLSN